MKDAHPAIRSNWEFLREPSCPLWLRNLACVATLALLVSQVNTICIALESQSTRRAPAKSPASSKASTLLAQAAAKENEKKFLDAEKLYRQAAGTDPSNAPAFEKLGALYSREERWQEAITAYESAMHLRPQSVSIKTKLAGLYEQTDRNADSIKLATSIPAERRPAPLLPVMAADYVSLNQSGEAQAFIAQTLQRAPADPELVPQLAEIFLRKGMAGDAAELLRIAEPHQKMTASFLTALSKAQARTGKQDEAKQTLAKALQLDPTNPEALLESGRQSGNEGDWKAAAGNLRTVRDSGPPRISVLQGLVFASMQIDDLQTAHDAALDLQAIKPDPESDLTLAVVLVRASHWGEAKPLLESALSAHPQEKRAQLALGIVLYNLSDLDRAQTLLTDSLGQGATDAEAHYMLGLIAKHRGDVPTAIAELEKATSLNSRKPEALSALGQLYLQQNDAEKARDVLEKAAQIVPQDSQNHYQLGLAYRKLGNVEKAREEMDLYRQLSARKVPQPVGENAAPAH